MGGREGEALVDLDAGVLVEELDHLRQIGLSHAQESSVAHLLTLARQAAPDAGLPPASELDRFLRLVIRRWGEGTATEAALCTFGLTARTRQQPAHVRRRAAAKVMELSEGHFRKTREQPLLADLAAEILVCSAAGPSPVGPTVPAPRPPATTVRVTTFDDEIEFSLRHLLEGAHSVLVHGKSWVNLFNQHLRKIVDVVARGGDVRILLVRGDPALAVGVYTSSAEVSGHILTRNLQTVLARLDEIRPEVDALPGRLEVRLGDVVPQYGFVGVGHGDDGPDRGVVQLNFAHTRVESDRFVLCLGQGPVLDGFVAEFQAAWAKASSGARP